MNQKKDQAPASADREIVITRIVDAPRELVWEVWTNPRHVSQWWGPNGFTTTTETMDIRPGGIWKHVMHGPDGTDYPNKSVFTEVVEPERISYAHTGARHGGTGVRFDATWTFEAVGNRTRVTMRSVFPTAADRDRVIREYGAVEGGNQTLNRLTGYLPKAPVIVERVLPAPVATVWAAITRPEQMKAWYFESLESFRPEVGFRTEVTVHHHGHDYRHHWEVTAVIPGRKIAYRWRYADNPGDSVVTFELVPAGDGTRLTLTHEGIETFRVDDNPDFARASFLAGWTSLIGASLPEYLGHAAGPDQPSVHRGNSAALAGQDRIGR